MPNVVLSNPVLARLVSDLGDNGGRGPGGSGTEGPEPLATITQQADGRLILNYAGAPGQTRILHRASSGGYDDPVLMTEPGTGFQMVASASGFGTRYNVAKLFSAGTVGSSVPIDPTADDPPRFTSLPARIPVRPMPFSVLNPAVLVNPEMEEFLVNPEMEELGANPAQQAEEGDLRCSAEAALTEPRAETGEGDLLCQAAIAAQWAELSVAERAAAGDEDVAAVAGKGDDHSGGKDDHSGGAGASAAAVV